MSEAHLTETWKDVERFPGYQVSDRGGIRGCRRGGTAGGMRAAWHPIKPDTLPNGYQQVSFYLNGKKARRNIHRLVLETFVGPCPPNMETRHLNGDRSDNRLGNVAWGTHQENVDDTKTHGTRLLGADTAAAKLTDELVARMLVEAHEGATVGDLSHRYGIRRENVSKILNNHHWRHVPGPRRVARKLA